MGNSPQFTIIDYDDSVTVNTNSDFAIKVTVRNVGDSYGDCEVRLRDHNGNVVSSETISLDAGAQVTFYIHATAPSTAGTYTWTLEAYNKTTDSVDDSKNVTVNVVSGGNPHFVIIDYPTNVKVNANEEFQIEVKIKNDGSQRGGCYVALYDHEGNRQDYDQPVIDANGVYTVFLKGTAPQYGGTYTWKVSVQNSITGNIDDEKEFTVEVSGSPPPSPLQELMNILQSLLPYIMWIVIILVAVAIIRLIMK